MRAQLEQALATSSGDGNYEWVRDADVFAALYRLHKTNVALLHVPLSNDRAKLVSEARDKMLRLYETVVVRFFAAQEGRANRALWRAKRALFEADPYKEIAEAARAHANERFSVRVVCFLSDSRTDAAAAVRRMRLGRVQVQQSLGCVGC